MIPAQKVTNKYRSIMTNFTTHRLPYKTIIPQFPFIPIIPHSKVAVLCPPVTVSLVCNNCVMEQSEDQPLQRQSDIYKRIRLLGSGSYGRAFLVRQVATGQEWAVKQVDLADLSPQEQADAMREAKILELLRHPNIIRFREVYRTAKGRLNIVMQYAEGGDLSQRIRKAKQSQTLFSEDQILSWFVQVCLAVRHLHDSKVIHRDLKPQNIFLTADSMVKVGDFGVSRLMENTVARARTVVGSPYYLSPEIVENRPYSFKTDIWSLGTLLFEMCALQPPFSAGSLQALALKIVQGGYAQIPRQYSQGLKGLLKWMLQTKEANRPTIHQLLLSPVIASRINRFIADSQTVLSPSPRLPLKLKPPPDLIALEGIENKSEVVVSKRWDQGRQDKEEESPIRGKAKTPQVAVRKGPNNFNYRPVSGKRKVDAPADLADLIQIKPSLLEAHEKPERMVLPKVLPPKSSQAFLPKPKAQPIREKQKDKEKQKQKEKPLTPPLANAFAKKRTSFTQAEGGTKREQVRSAVDPGKRSEKRPLPNQKEKPQKVKPLMIIQKDKKKVVASNAPKPQIRKKLSKPASQTKLEICSQQIKKKDAKVQKKPLPKKQKSQKKPMLSPPPKLQQAMQEQKCNWQQQKNSNPSSYYNDSFQSYSSGSELGQEVDLSLSDTLSPTPTSNFRNMLKEMEDIQAALEQQPDTLPAAGQSIPELLEYSNYPRVDDEEEPPTPSAIEKQEAFPQSQLQSLRINLQEIFGVENIIYAYHTIESKMGEVGLALNQPEVIAEIMAGRPQMEEATLQAYFRLIVTIVGMEMGLF